MQEFFHSSFWAGLEGEEALNAARRQRAGCWRVGERERGFRHLLLTGIELGDGRNVGSLDSLLSGIDALEVAIITKIITS
jgi:hypothetical protein